MSKMYYVSKAWFADESSDDGNVGEMITPFVASTDQSALGIFEAISLPYSHWYSVGEDITDTALSDDNGVIAYYRGGELVDMTF